ncbi:hypothetical protein TSOC_003872 [Tetrabaena socialis]|uniref:AB hydrolase-1 domain-containing protein n=1 Tax=Tetrabaena socialis TaxID=47790 RepID=A0A2J8AAJ8_9CHLO|nr:hypothetical protein TSOC_003872 [Tetrabaena socialis]|eukprot:PNH09493.1 hypothetical protein TSOC_003872 [Tetrabaena socialis]
MWILAYEAREEASSPSAMGLRPPPGGCLCPAPSLPISMPRMAPGAEGSGLVDTTTAPQPSPKRMHVPASGKGQERLPTYTVDLVGWGFTDASLFASDPALVIRPADKAAHLRAFLAEHTDGRPVVLVGASLGGAKALDFAHAFPELVRASLAPRSLAPESWPLAFRASQLVREVTNHCTVGKMLTTVHVTGLCPGEKPVKKPVAHPPPRKRTARGLAWGGVGACAAGPNVLTWGFRRDAASYAPLVVPCGTAVTFAWNTTGRHDVVQVAKADCNSTVIETLAVPSPLGNATVTFTKRGSYHYLCAASPDWNVSTCARSTEQTEPGHQRILRGVVRRAESTQHQMLPYCLMRFWKRFCFSALLKSPKAFAMVVKPAAPTSSVAGVLPSLQAASPAGHTSTTTRSSRTRGVMRLLLKKVYSRISVDGPISDSGQILGGARVLRSKPHLSSGITSARRRMMELMAKAWRKRCSWWLTSLKWPWPSGARARRTSKLTKPTVWS